MPDNSANRAAMRAAGHSIRCYASFVAPSPIATGTLTNTPGYPINGASPYINTTYSVGAYTDVLYGMEVAFFDTATGAFKGRTHVRYGGTIDALNIPIREFTQAMLNLVAGDTFKVYNEFRLHDKLVAALGDFPPDMRFYADADAGDEPEPVANSGGDTACMVDGFGTSSELSYATVQMTGSTSFTVYPTGGSITHSWTFPAGVSLAPGSSATDANPVLRVNVGTYVITHTVTDVASGRSRASHPSIRVHNGSSLPHRVIVTQYDGTSEDGWNWEVEVVSGAVDFTTIPDGCKVILWGRERINGAWQSFRNNAPGRGHILGVGYAARDTSSGSGTDGAHHLTFEVISPLARLKEIKSYSKVMLENANPNSWSEVTELGVIRGFLQVLQFYTMWGEAGFDTIIDADVFDERYPAHFLDASDFYTQLVELSKAIDARMTCDRTGRLDVHTHPAHIPLADRAAVTVALELADADILDYEWTREHHVKVEQMKVSGVSGGATGNLPVFSLYPGKAAGEGIDAPEIARLILDATNPQDDINERAGRYGALADMLFYDEDGIRHNAFDLKLTLRGSYDCFDFYKEYIELTISDNRRGLDFSGRRFYLLDSHTSFEADGTSTTEVTLRMETNAAEGETYIPPSDSTDDDGEEPPYEPPITVPVEPGIISGGTGRLVFIDSAGYLYYTDSANSASPVWARIALTPTGTPMDCVPYAFSPLYLNQTGDLYIYLLTTTRIARVAFDGSALSASLTNQVSFSAASAGRIETERGIEGLVAASLLYSGGNNSLIVTTDGVNWGSPQVINTSAGSHSASGLYVSGKVSGNIYVSENTTTGTTSAGKVSVNGAAAGSLSSPNLASKGFNGGLHFPWHNAPSDSVAIFGVDDIPRALTLANGASQSDITPAAFNGSTGGAYGTRAIDTSPQNRNLIACVLRNGTNPAGSGSDTLRIHYSSNGANTWGSLDTLDGTASGGAYYFVRVAGDARVFWAFGAGGRIVKCDFEGRYQDLYGNLGDFSSPSVATILNIFGF